MICIVSCAQRRRSVECGTLAVTFGTGAISSFEGRRKWSNFPELMKRSSVLIPKSGRLTTGSVSYLMALRDYLARENANVLP